MVKSRDIFGDGCFPTFNDGILIMGPYKPLRNWVDEFIPYYMEISWELIDPGFISIFLFSGSKQVVSESIKQPFEPVDSSIWYVFLY